jgi:hypothetical protein
MGDITAPRIEPLAESSSRDEYPSKKGTPRKREDPEKPLSSPSIESDDVVEEIHQIDELA